MKIDVLTLFPEMFEATFGVSIIKRAADNGLIDLRFVNIRDFSEDKHKRVDDYPYGAGGGLVMQPMPIFAAYEHLCKESDEKPYVIYMSPQGKTFTQKKAIELKEHKHLILLCGHYEGVDQRVLDEIVDEEISIGDYVLTGGEIPACIMVDAVSRLVPGVLSDKECYEKESIASGLLEYPQYTRPREFNGLSVPEVLLSGHHENIEKWRFEKSLELTKERRPDLYEKYVSENKK